MRYLISLLTVCLMAAVAARFAANGILWPSWVLGYAAGVITVLSATLAQEAKP